MKWAIAFVAGLLAGVVLMMVIRPDRSAELAAVRQEAAEATKALQATKQQLSKAQEESHTVGLATPARKSAVGKKGAASKAGIFGEKFSKAIGEFTQSQVKVQIEGKLGQIIERLALTPAQEAQLRGLVEPQIGGLLGQVQGALEGKVTPTNYFAHAAAIQLGQLPNEIESTLTPEQKTAYEAFKEEERSNRIETRASAELMNLQGIGLTQEQKDKAFEAFCRLAQEDETTTIKAGTQGGATPGKDYMEKVFSRRIEALKGVLTESQMKGYEAQIEMHRKIMEEMGVGTGAAPNPKK